MVGRFSCFRTRDETYLIGIMRDRTIHPMNVADAHAYILERLGRDLAPTLHTWRSWMRPSGRMRSPVVMRARCVPQPVRVPGKKALLLRVADLDRFIARALELSQRPSTPAT